MAFNMTTQLTTIFDSIVVGYISSTSSDIIVFLTPLIGIALTISLMIRGILSTMQDGPPLIDHVRTYMFFALMTSVAGLGGIYQTTIADMIMGIPDALSLAVMGEHGAGDSTTMANAVDTAMDQGIETMKLAWDGVSWDILESLVAVMVGGMIMVATLVICGVGFALILVSKFMLGVLAAFGPAFIFLLCFDSTKGMADKWIGMVVNHGTVMVILASVFGLLMTIFSGIVSNIGSDTENLLAQAFAADFFMIVAIFILLEVKGIAQSIGSGASIALMSQTQKLASASSSVGRAMAREAGGTPKAGAPNSGGGVGRTAPGAASGVASQASGGVGNRVQAAYKGTRR